MPYSGVRPRREGAVANAVGSRHANRVRGYMGKDKVGWPDTVAARYDTEEQAALPVSLHPPRTTFLD